MVSKVANELLYNLHKSPWMLKHYHIEIKTPWDMSSVYPRGEVILLPGGRFSGQGSKAFSRTYKL